MNKIYLYIQLRRSLYLGLFIKKAKRRDFQIVVQYERSLQVTALY